MCTANEPNNCTFSLGSPKTKVQMSLRVFGRSALVMKILLMYGLRLENGCHLFVRNVWPFRNSCFISGNMYFNFAGDFGLLLLVFFSLPSQLSSVSSPSVSSGLHFCPPISANGSTLLLLPAVDVLFSVAVALGVTGRHWIGGVKGGKY
jgi:hypothetical protein